MNIVINSKFRPFSYDELIKPLLQYKEEYDKREAAFSTLQQQADAWKNIATQTKNPLAYSMYTKFNNDLTSAVNNFKQGMTLQNRGALMDMNKRYMSDIKPISDAATKKEALSAEQRKLQASNPSLIFQRNADNMSIDDFIRNPMQDYGQVVNGDAITKSVATAAQALSKQAAESNEGKARLKALLPFQYEYITQTGYNPTEIMKAILRSDRADAILTGIVDNAVASTGISQWNNPQALQRAYDYANQGLWYAVGEAKSQILKDDYSASVALARAKARLDAEVAGNNNLTDQVPNALLQDYTQLSSGDEKNAEDEQKKGRSVLSILGINPDTGKRANKVNAFDLKSVMPDRSTYKKAPIFSSNGRLKTRYQYIAQGNTPIERETLAKYYDTQVVPKLQSIGMNVGAANRLGKTFTAKGIYDTAMKYVNAKNGSLNMDVINLRIYDPKKTFQDRIIPLLKTDEGKKLNMEEITGYDSKGNFKTSGKRIDTDDILNSKNDLDDSPVFYAAVNSNDIIMKYNGKSYAIKSKDLSKSIGNNPAIREVLNRSLSQYKEAVNKLIQKGFSPGEAEETVKRSSIGNTFNNAINAYQKEYIDLLDYKNESPVGKVTASQSSN